MKTNCSVRMVLAAAGVVMTTPALCVAAGEPDLADIQKQIQALRSEYETRIKALETRLQSAEAEAQAAHHKAAAAESAAAQSAAAAQAGSPPPANAPSSASAFNPAIGVILDAKARYYSKDLANFQIPGFVLPDEGGIGAEGVSLGESELNFYANIDDKFYGSLTASLEEENGDTTASVEEAFIQTLTLPAGLTLKAGRFFSNVGYLNPTHTHADDFADRPLPNRVFLNSQFGDDGVQLRWIAPTDLFVELGGELLRGASFPASGASENGKGIWTLFGHAGGDVGVSNSWRAGLSYVSARADGRETGEPADSFSGDSNLWIADLIWKWAPNGDAVNRSAKLQAEYFRRDEDGEFTPAGGLALPLSTSQDGFYVQGIYQFMPQWRVGLRYAQLDAENLGADFAGTTLDDRDHTPRTLSAMIDWSNSEFSRVRLQYNRDESSLRGDDQIVLQYIVSLGAHGAHLF